MVRKIDALLAVVIVAVITLNGGGQVTADPTFQRIVALIYKSPRAAKCDDLPLKDVFSLLERNPQLLRQRDREYKASLLHWAALSGNPCIIRRILQIARSTKPSLDIGLLLKARSDDNDTPLHKAVLAEPEAAEAVEVLLNTEGIEVSARGTGRATPLHYAAKNGYAGVVRLLLGKVSSKEEVDAVTEQGATPLYAVCDREPKATKLPQTGPSNSAPPTHPIEEIVRLLLDKGADPSAMAYTVVTEKPNLHIMGGLTPLHRAVQLGNHEAVKAIFDYLKSRNNLRDKDIRGGIIDIRNFDGDTPLHIAARKGDVKMMQLLVQDGNASVRLPDGNGNLSLHLFLNRKIPASDWGRAIDLLRKDININFKGQDGNTPLHLAARQGDIEIMSKVLREGGDSTLKNDEGKIPENLISDRSVLAKFQGIVIGMKSPKPQQR